MIVQVVLFTLYLCCMMEMLFRCELMPAHSMAPTVLIQPLANDIFVMPLDMIWPFWKQILCHQYSSAWSCGVENLLRPGWICPRRKDIRISLSCCSPFSYHFCAEVGIFRRYYCN
uniref:Secreted protein n=1 Tax=Arundo donax TaxID=35708 RepID=A0A0A9EBP7_ARUDO